MTALVIVGFIRAYRFWRVVGMVNIQCYRASLVFLFRFPGHMGRSVSSSIDFLK